MRKQIFGRQLQRDTNERKALFKSLMEELVMHESIQTTEPKAKAIKGQIEKLVTKANKNPDAKRQLQRYFAPEILNKFMTDIAPRFAQRPGGYTRIIKLGNRLRDNAKMVIIEWVVKKEPVAATPKTENKSAEKTETVEATAPVSKEKKETKKVAKKETKKKESKK